MPHKKPIYRYPLTRLPEKTDMALFTLGEELKSRALFQGFQSVGLDDCYLQPHLDLLILRLVGLDTSDETFARYEQIMAKRSKKIEADRESITRQALKAYQELQQLRKALTAE